MPIDMKSALGLLAASAVRRSIKPKALALAGTVLMSTFSTSPLPAFAQDAAKPNILVIFGDDIGQTNISAYSMGVMGYKTPNIDRLASEGVLFTDYYAENSCTAGRSTFITGQSVLRTGMSKVGAPGAPVGIQARDVTIAQALKPLGYATGQFGKNHLGDKDEYLPTAHGFDEFFGNLYHLNAEEEPERPYWPKDPNDPFVKNFSPRGVLHTFADGKIEDTGALNTKRMETIDDETTAAAIGFMEKQVKEGKPFFTWMNTTRMHLFTHVRPEYQGQSGMPGNEYADGMIEHDNDVGKLLKAIDDLKIADNTIVVYATDNGPNQFSWPDAATTPFRSEKDTNWEGAFRVPAMIRWPGKIKPGVSNEMISGSRLVPDAAGSRWRQRHQGSPAEGSQAWRQGLQGPPRRLQPASLSDRGAAEERAQRVLLFQRRRQACRHAMGQLEGRLLRNAQARRFRSVAGSLRVPPRSENLQPENGSV